MFKDKLQIKWNLDFFIIKKFIIFKSLLLDVQSRVYTKIYFI